MNCKWCSGKIDESKLSKYASGKFCSKRCASLYSRSKIDTDRVKRGFCCDCGIEMTIKVNANSRQSKCDSCRKTPKKADSKEESGNTRRYKIEDILNNKYPKYGSSKLRKRLIKEGYKEYKCEICGLDEWLGRPIQLILDHIDGDPYNHNLENLRIVCPNCDAQLPTYCSKNNGNGRIYRRLQYHKDKNRRS